MVDTTRRQFAIGASAIASAAYLAPARADQVDDKIRIGQIGVGHAHASGKMGAMRKLADTYDVVGLADPDPARAASAVNGGAYRELKAMSIDDLLATPGIKAVAVETDVRDLVPTAMRCIEAGLHVHLDKPAGESLTAFAKLCAEADRRERTIQMGYMLRYNPAFELLFAAVRDGWLGEVYEVDAMMGKLAPAGLRRELNQYAGGGMFELACHLIDAVVTVMGKPDRVTPYTRRTKAPGDALADNQLAVLEYAKATATIRCSHVDPFGGPRRRFQIAGSGGVIEIKPLESGEMDLMLTEARGPYKAGAQHVKLPGPGGRYDGEFVDLAKVIRGEKKLAWDRAHDLAVHETVLRASELAVE